MGQANNKPRQLSMDADADDSIDVSNDVVKRLKTGLKENKEAVKPVQETQKRATHSAPAHINRSQIYTSMEARKEKEAALAQNDKFWRDKMSTMEGNFQKANKIDEDEFFAAVDEINKRFDSPTNSIRPIPPCQTQKTAMMACYGKNKNETLMCSKEAREFVSCVGLYRINLLDGNKKP